MVSGGATSRIGTGKALSIMKIAQFVNVFLFAMVAGIFWAHGSVSAVRFPQSPDDVPGDRTDRNPEPSALSEL